jgi:formylglycine-generating enzyme required for sulfatase activity
MIVVPAGEFMMGSNEHDNEKPVHRVTIRAPFAVGRFAVTFEEWDAAGLAHKPSEEGWGRGRRPVINVSCRGTTRKITCDGCHSKRVESTGC